MTVIACNRQLTGTSVWFGRIASSMISCFSFSQGRTHITSIRILVELVCRVLLSFPNFACGTRRTRRLASGRTAQDSSWQRKRWYTSKMFWLQPLPLSDFLRDEFFTRLAFGSYGEPGPYIIAFYARWTHCEHPPRSYHRIRVSEVGWACSRDNGLNSEMPCPRGSDELCVIFTCLRIVLRCLGNSALLNSESVIIPVFRFASSMLRRFRRTPHRKPQWSKEQILQKNSGSPALWAYQRLRKCLTEAAKNVAAKERNA